MRGTRTPSARAISLGRGLLVMAALGGALGLVAASSACGTDPVGVDDCRRIEKVRCEAAPACGINLQRPPHSGSTDQNNVAACIRYYDDACLHGLVLKKEPARSDVDACVNAIINGDCTIVDKPETHPECAFLVPPTPAAPVVDAGSDASAAPDADASP
jgi:hypothetical protein